MPNPSVGANGRGYDSANVQIPIIRFAGIFRWTRGTENAILYKRFL